MDISSRVADLVEGRPLRALAGAAYGGASGAVAGTLLTQVSVLAILAGLADATLDDAARSVFFVLCAVGAVGGFVLGLAGWRRLDGDYFKPGLIALYTCCYLFLVDSWLLR